MKENPLFATNIIKNFQHCEEIDEILLQKLNWEKKNDIGISILPIIDRPSEGKRAILRVFIANFSDAVVQLSIFYSSVGWFTDLKKFYTLNSLNNITIQPREVWYRDCIIGQLIREGKNYIEFVLVPVELVKKFKKKKLMSSEIEEKVLYYVTEVTQITKVTDPHELERKMFLGLTDKPHVSPQSSAYWLFCSLFGTFQYNTEAKFILWIKVLGFITGLVSIMVGLSNYGNLQGLFISIGFILTVTGFFSFFSNRDKNIIKFCWESGIIQDKKKASPQLAKHASSEFYKHFGDKNKFYGFNSNSNNFYWKKNPLRSTIEQIAKALDMKLELEEPPKEERKQISEKEEEEKVHTSVPEYSGIDLRKESEGIESDTVIHIPIKLLDSNEMIRMEVGEIEELENSMNKDAEGIAIKEYIEPANKADMINLTKDVKGIRIKGYLTY